jgi:hypothetical protein
MRVEEFVKEVVDHVIADCQLPIANLATRFLFAPLRLCVRSPLVFSRQGETLAQSFDDLIGSDAARALY